MFTERSFGVLLHPTCLESPFGIGDLGPGAERYLAWLQRARARWWQILPLNPPGAGNSPYSATSTFAGNELLVSPELLVADGLLSPGEVPEAPQLPATHVEYGPVTALKTALLDEAWRQFSRTPGPLADEWEAFRDTESSWLEEYALFAALKQAHGGEPWHRWPAPLAGRDPAALAGWQGQHREAVGRVAFGQFLFFRQWRRLRELAAAAGVRILGDVPIFVSYDSADVWAHRELFRLDEAGRPETVAGVPPDYFSATGQLWGNPVYRWDVLAADGYGWWVDRLGHTLTLVDAVRLDHFRGFAAAWEVAAGETTAVAGHWIPGPGKGLFEAVRSALGTLPLLAEDLGDITPDVVTLRDELGLPGMAVLHFAFNPHDRNAFLPYHHRENLVVYTGTHDNNTSLGWFLGDAGDAERDYLRRYTGSEGMEPHWDMVRLAMASVAALAVIPHQDAAGLGADCRMNTPGVAEGNWRFRVTPWMLDGALADRLADLAWIFGRS